MPLAIRPASGGASKIWASLFFGCPCFFGSVRVRAPCEVVEDGFGWNPIGQAPWGFAQVVAMEIVALEARFPSAILEEFRV